jgi:hypothetical protein
MLTDDSFLYTMTQRRREAQRALENLNEMLALRPHLAEGFSVDGLRLEIFRLEDTFPEKLKREKAA